MSAVVLRELVAKLGLAVDDSAFERADKGLANVKKGLEDVDRKARDTSGRFVRGAREQAAAVEAQAGNHAAAARKAAGASPSAADTFEKYLGAAAVFQALRSMTELASAANETENVLKELFGAPGLDQIKEWSDATSVTLNRSKYQLREAAGTFGALLSPVNKDTNAVRQMSETLSVLGIDLASFYNTTDEEAMLALRSALIGQSEPLLKYAINVQDATLKETARRMGITKSIEKMTQAEKTQIRYKAILEQSTKATGDATRTAGEYANTLRGLEARVKELATSLGKQLLPPLKAFYTWATDSITALGRLTDTSNLFQGALAALGIVILQTFGAKLWALTTFGAKLAVIAFILDDIITFSKGGKSSIGDLLNALGGEGTDAKWLKAISEALRDMKRDWDAFVLSFKAFPFEDTWNKYAQKVHLMRVELDQISRAWTKLMTGRERGSLITKEQYERYGRGKFSKLDAESDDEQQQAADDARSQEARLRSDAAAALRIARERNDAAARLGAPSPGDPEQQLNLASEQISTGVQSEPNMSVQVGDMVFNVTLPAGASADDMRRVTQRAAEIERRTTLEAIRNAAGRQSR